MGATPQLEIIGVALLAFLSTSLDNLGVLAALFATRELRPGQLAAEYLAITGALTALGWAAALLAEMAIAEHLAYLGWIPIGLGLRSAWRLRGGTRASEPMPPPAGWLAAALLILSTSADNLLISISLFAHSPRASDPLLFVTLVVCSAAWCGLAFWIARRSPIAGTLQRWARPLLPFLLVAVGVYILSETPTEVPRLDSEIQTSLEQASSAQSVASRECLRPYAR